MNEFIWRKFQQEFNHQPQPMPMTQMQAQPAPAVSHRQYQTSYQMQQQSQPMVQSYSTSHSSFHVSSKRLHKPGNLYLSWAFLVNVGDDVSYR